MGHSRTGGTPARDTPRFPTSPASPAQRAPREGARKTIVFCGVLTLYLRKTSSAVFQIFSNFRVELHASARNPLPTSGPAG